MKKNIKYVIALFLVFGLVVNDCTLYSQSNSAHYYQFSNVFLRTELNKKSSTLYVYNQADSPEKTCFSIPLSYLKLKDSHTFQDNVVLKNQTAVFRSFCSKMLQNIFVNEMITSTNSYKNLYIA